jgi:hypothetical protein
MFTLRDYYTAPEKKDKRIIKDNIKSGDLSWKMHKHTGGDFRYDNSQKSAAVTYILENVKEFNEALKLPIKEGLGKIKDTVKVQGNMQTFLKTLGFSSTKNYYEPWWLHIRTRGKHEIDYLLKLVKPAIFGYSLRTNNVDLYLHVKNEHLDHLSIKKKRELTSKTDFKTRFNKEVKVGRSRK